LHRDHTISPYGTAKKFFTLCLFFSACFKRRLVRSAGTLCHIGVHPLEGYISPASVSLQRPGLYAGHPPSPGSGLYVTSLSRHGTADSTFDCNQKVGIKNSNRDTVASSIHQLSTCVCRG
jgi:hypothetical protein